MDHFVRQGNELFAEDVSFKNIAKQFGTPTYVYSRATIERHVRVLREGLGNLSHTICYAVKANANAAILQLLRELGCHFDAVSGGELARVMKIGGNPKQTIFSGVGKTDAEIENALQLGVLYLGVESADELSAIARIAELLGVEAPIAIRVNPDVDAQTHPKISTGMKQNKFGVPVNEARSLYQEYVGHPHVKPVGVTCHIGSQITKIEPFEDAAHRMADLARELHDLGAPLSHVGMGGGLGVPFADEEPPSPKHYGEMLRRVLGPLGLTVVLEPGRVIVGNAGVLLTQVVRQKQGLDRKFVLVDAAMTDLIRPALYQADHKLVVVSPREGNDAPADVVGPVCESSDTFCKDVSLPPLQNGDLLVLRTAGAYGFVMASMYNGRPLACEVLVDGNKVVCVRDRDSVERLWYGERGLDGARLD